MPVTAAAPVAGAQAGLVGPHSFTVALLGAHMDEAAMIASPEVAAVVAAALAALRTEIERQRAGGVPVFPLSDGC